MKSLYLLLLFCFCTTSFAQRTIDLYNNLSNGQSVNLSSIANNIRYVPLETTENCLLSDDLQVYCTLNYLFVGDQKTNCFYRFDKSGKFLNIIGRKGDGPEEYPNALFFYVDEASENVNIISAQTKHLYKYSYSGVFQNKIALPESSWMINRLGNNYVFYNNRFNRIKNNPNVKELFLVNPQGKLIKSVPTTIKEEEFDLVLFEFPFFYTYKNTLYYKNPLLDDVFQIDNNLNLKSVYNIYTGPKTREKNDIKKPEQYAKRISVRCIFENEKITLVTYVYQNDFHYLLVDKNSGKTTNVGRSVAGFNDDLKNGPLFRPYWLAQSKQNLLVSVLTYDEVEKQKQSFENIISKQAKLINRQADDNPIIVVVELK